MALSSDSGRYSMVTTQVPAPPKWELVPLRNLTAAHCRLTNIVLLFCHDNDH